MCFFILLRGSLSVDSKFSMDGMCVVALAPATSTMSGATFHPFEIMLLISGWYFVVFLSRVYAVNLSLQYVNSMNCMVILVVRVSGGGWLYGCPMTHNISSLHRALQWHLWVPHVHGNSHVGTVFSWGCSLCVPAFMSV